MMDNDEHCPDKALEPPDELLGTEEQVGKTRGEAKVQEVEVAE